MEKTPAFQSAGVVPTCVAVSYTHLDVYKRQEYEFISAEQVDRDNDTITYVFTFRIEADATSFDYWGRDDETCLLYTSLFGHAENEMSVNPFCLFVRQTGNRRMKLLHGHFPLKIGRAHV